jgi:hypothetical protein
MNYWSDDPELEAELCRILAPMLPHFGPPTQDLCANFDPVAGDCTLHFDAGRGPMFALDHRCHRRHSAFGDRGGQIAQSHCPPSPAAVTVEKLQERQ